MPRKRKSEPSPALETKNKERKMKISTETKIMTSVSAMFDFTSNHTRNRIIEANRRKLIAGIELNENQIAALNNLIEASIREAMVKSSNEVVNVIKALEL